MTNFLANGGDGYAMMKTKVIEHTLSGKNSI